MALLGYLSLWLACLVGLWGAITGFVGGAQGRADLQQSARHATFALFGALAVGRDAMTVGGLVAFVALVIGLVWPVEALGWILANAQEAATAAERVWEVFDSTPSIIDERITNISGITVWIFDGFSQRCLIQECMPARSSFF